MRTWDDLRFFLSVASERSLAKAAKKLNVNKSTVSRRIAALEEEMAIRLLEMRGRGYALTSEGERLLEHARTVEERIASMERELVGRDSQLAGAVTLATTEPLAREVLAPYLLSFAKAYPRVCVNVLTGNQALRLAEGHASVALRHGDKPTDGEVVAKGVCEVSGAFYASQQYLVRQGRPKRRQDLVCHKMVGVHASLGHLPAAKLVDALVPADCISMRCSDLGSQVAAVEVGLGVAPLPCFIADRRPSLVRLFEPEEQLRGTLWLIPTRR
ncbi:MAG TPA: LysR family transcriptional regulator [Polyangiaceae bacterium]|nr:LysR family transcriptional regulator [Polyangiaceae bacterium]